MGAGAARGLESRAENVGPARCEANPPLSRGVFFLLNPRCGSSPTHLLLIRLDHAQWEQVYSQYYS
jgi:hypothetical protein